MQYGPASLFPRAADLPAGPPSDDAVLVTCAYLLATAQPWVEQSLFLAAIGEARDKGAQALEAFAYRYRGGRAAGTSASSSTEPSSRATSSPTSAFGTVRTQGRIELARLDLGGLQPVEEGSAREGAPGRAGGVRSRRPRPLRRERLPQRQLAVPASANVLPRAGRKRQSYPSARSVSRSTPNVVSLTTSLRRTRHNTG